MRLVGAYRPPPLPATRSRLLVPLFVPPCVCSPPSHYTVVQFNSSHLESTVDSLTVVSSTRSVHPPSLPVMAGVPSTSAPSPTADPHAELALLRREVIELQQFATQQLAQRASHASSGVRAPDLPKIRAPSLYGGAMGTGCDDWLSEINQQFAYYGSKFPTPTDKINFAAAHFNYAALHWWEQQTPADRQGLVSWEQFVGVLRDRFRPIQAAMFARQKLGKLRMTDKHKVNQYVSVFQSVMTPILDMGDADQVHQFVNGLLPALAAKVWERHPKNLKEAIEHAILVESMQEFGRASTPYRAGPFHSYSGGRGPAAGGAASTSSPMEISALEIDSFSNDTVDASAPSDHASVLQAQVESLELKLNALQSGAGSFIPQSHGARGRGDRIPGLTPDIIAKLRKDGKCFKCKQKGHMKGECTNPAKNY